ncbi:hypothetical protein AB0M35_28985 [Micromonospora sp. NPDC051196]|uniref:hypothetical protein n=1 Tax=Micromonospora sp. NPDC051196 TaxID=3155281 RepID=UPI0034252D7D
MLHPALTAMAYGLVAVFGLLAAGLIGFLQWNDGAESSTVVITAGAAALSVMTLGITLIGQIQHS